jgi:hypothetical protein
MPTDSKVRHQLELLPTQEPYVEPVTPELVRLVKRKPTFLAAWNLAQTHADLEDKQCYQPLGIEASHWTKIGKGLASPPGDERFVRYMDVVRNEIPLIWLVEARGYDFLSLRKHRSDHERRIAELEEENRELKRSMVRWVEASKGKG